MKNGRAVEYPGATYYLRYSVDGKRKWEDAGTEPQMAFTHLQSKRGQFQGLVQAGTLDRVSISTAAVFEPPAEILPEERDNSAPPLRRY
jgi:hypothetical protein